MAQPNHAESATSEPISVARDGATTIVRGASGPSAERSRAARPDRVQAEFAELARGLAEVRDSARMTEAFVTVRLLPAVAEVVKGDAALSRQLVAERDRHRDRARRARLMVACLVALLGAEMAWGTASVLLAKATDALAPVLAMAASLGP